MLDSFGGKTFSCIAAPGQDHVKLHVGHKENQRISGDVLELVFCTNGIQLGRFISVVRDKLISNHWGFLLRPIVMGAHPPPGGCFSEDFSFHQLYEIF